jgi:hypothetical protein
LKFKVCGGFRCNCKYVNLDILTQLLKTQNIWTAQPAYRICTFNEVGKSKKWKKIFKKRKRREEKEKGGKEKKPEGGKRKMMDKKEKGEKKRKRREEKEKEERKGKDCTLQSCK